MSKKPNLLFILQDHQAYYGHEMRSGETPKRPNFKAFAETGANFTHNYAVTPMCGPARRSFLTGLYPHTHGQVHNENDPHYAHDVYLDDLVQDGGYQSFYYGKWHAGPGCAYDHLTDGFSQQGYGNCYNTPEYRRYCEERGLPRHTARIDRAFVIPGFKTYKRFKEMVPGALYQSTEYFSGEHATGITVTPEDTHEAFFVANMVCDKLEELAKDTSGKPWAVRADFWGPHQPFFPTQKYLDMYDKTKIEPYPSRHDPLTDKPNILRVEASRPLCNEKGIVNSEALSDEEWQDILHHCYAHISMVDAAGGRILDKLKELGLDENTLIIWTTDHGDAISCHGGHFDKDSHMAMEVLNTPLAVSWKGHIEPGQTFDGYTCTFDVPVTMMQAAGCQWHNEVDGQSLTDMLDGTIPARDTIMLETYGHGYGTTIIGRCLIHQGWKYNCTENDLDELYNLNDDPFELKNLAILPEYAEKRMEMRNLLRAEQKKYKDPVSLDDICPDEGNDVELVPLP